MTKPTVVNDLSIGKKIKYALPHWLFRPLSVVYNTGMKAVPVKTKYSMSAARRKGKFPYKLLGDDDVAVQVGAPRDILMAGRSRSIHLALSTRKGKVLVCEPDPLNCAAFKAFIEKHDLADRVFLYEGGLWSEPGELTFLSSPNHPAANVLVDARDDISEALKKRRDYQRIPVPVQTLDAVLADRGLKMPKLVSITTNGAEIPIVQGMSGLIESGLPYISLASTGEGFHEFMEGLGYEYIARDDRGYTFRRVGLQTS